MSDDLQRSSSSSKSSASRSSRMLQMLNDEPPRRKSTPAMGVDTAWALKLKEAINTTVRELHVQVLSAKPICETSDAGNMRFEMETDQGVVIAIRSRDGKYIFEWQ